MTSAKPEARALAERLALRYRAGSRAEKSRILNHICALTGWHRDHARRALRQALTPRRTAPRRRRSPVYNEEVVWPLRVIWTVAGFPCGKRLARHMDEIIEILEAAGALELTPSSRERLLRISAATIDRKLTPDRLRLGR